MMRFSDKLKGYDGLNPFRDSQSKMYGDEKIAGEFYPTSTFWSLFNEQHEILLGSRGSGKTVLLRMLSFSCLSRYAQRSGNAQATEYVENKPFIGFYIPMHLEFAAALSADKHPTAQSITYFQFAFNCMAAQSLLDQVEVLLHAKDLHPRSHIEQLSGILDHVSKRWFPKITERFTSLAELREWIMQLYSVLEPVALERSEDARLLAKPILRPILHVLPGITKGLGLDSGNTRWLACIDEAEFLQQPYIECINTFLRDEKRPLVVKMATLPFRHSSRATLHDGVEIEPDGSDFNYRCIDMECESDDFRHVTDHITDVRLKRTGLSDLPQKTISLSAFVGTEGKDEPADYFRLEMRSVDPEWDEEPHVDEIVAELGDARKKHFRKVQHDPDKFVQPILKKFRPVYFVRKMKAESVKGNRTVGWFAGAANIRHVADGNPRTFIQVMNLLVDTSRETHLTPKSQHRVLTEFCKRRYEASEALPEHGVTTKALIDIIGRLLEDRVHGRHMVDSGCHFRISPTVLDDVIVKDALSVAVGYTHILVDKDTLLLGLSSDTDFRLSYSYCVTFWLPMRRGQPRVIGLREHRLLQWHHVADNPPATTQEAQQLVRQLKLDFIDEEDDAERHIEE